MDSYLSKWEKFEYKLILNVIINNFNYGLLEQVEPVKGHGFLMVLTQERT